MTRKSKPKAAGGGAQAGTVAACVASVVAVAACCASMLHDGTSSVTPAGAADLPSPFLPVFDAAPSCARVTFSAAEGQPAAWLEGARPVVVLGLFEGALARQTPQGPSWLPRNLLSRSLVGTANAPQQENELRVDVTPHPLAPLKLKLKRGDATLVRPAERRMSPPALLALLRNRSRGYHAYVRYLPLMGEEDGWLRRLSDALPLGDAMRLVGDGLQEANLWLGDGGMSSALHLDGMDNLLLQLQGSKQLLLLPPAAHAAAGYRLWHERRFLFDESHGRFARGDEADEGGWETEATGWPRVANHAALDVFRDVFRGGGEPTPAPAHAPAPGRAGVDGDPQRAAEQAANAEHAADASAAAAAGALRCTLRAGEALFLPALWSHAVASEGGGEGGGEAGDGEAGSGSAAGLNAAANLWFVRGSHSFAAALTARPDSSAEVYFQLGEAHRLRGRVSEAEAAYLAARTVAAGGLASAAPRSHAGGGNSGSASELTHPAESALAQLLAEGGRLHEALPRFMALTSWGGQAADGAASPDGAPSAWLNAGHALAQLDRPAEAVRAYAAASRLAPRWVDEAVDTAPLAQAHAAVAAQLASRGAAPAELLPPLRRALALQPLDAQVRQALAKTLGALGRTDESEATLRAAMQHSDDRTRV